VPKAMVCVPPVPKDVSRLPSSFRRATAKVYGAGWLRLVASVGVMVLMRDA